MYAWTLNNHMHATVQQPSTPCSTRQTGRVICSNSAVISEFSNFRMRFISPEGKRINLPVALAVCCQKIDALGSPPDTIERSYLPASSMADHCFSNTTPNTQNPQPWFHSHTHTHCVFHTRHFALAHRAAAFKPVTLTNGRFWLNSLLMFSFLLF